MVYTVVLWALHLDNSFNGSHLLTDTSARARIFNCFIWGYFYFIRSGFFRWFSDSDKWDFFIINFCKCCKGQVGDDLRNYIITRK